MKLRTIAPALLAVAALVVVYIVTRDRDEPAPAAKPAVVEAPHTAAPAAPALPSAPAPTADKPVPQLVDPAEAAEHMPQPKKAQMTLADKLAEAKKHIDVIERRATLLEQEIAELERQGKQQQAAEQRIVLQRLRAHADKLRSDVAAGREPE